MEKIKLQKKTKPLSGSIEVYWFENKEKGIDKTLFHRIIIPLEPFDSGLDYVEQPEETEVYAQWFALNLSDPKNLGGLDLSHASYPDAEASIYLGSAHNPCDIHKLEFEKINEATFKVTGVLIVDFAHEGVGKNEKFKFTTQVEYIGEQHSAAQIKPNPTKLKPSSQEGAWVDPDFKPKFD